MASIFDAASYILSKCGPMTTMKMQKLLYYCQAWHLVWDDEPLFDSEFEAWANGPVSPEYFSEHKGNYNVAAEPRGTIGELTASQIGTIDGVLKVYGNKSPQWLSDLTHREKPWMEARKGLKDGERGNRTIPRVLMTEFYGSL